MTNHSVAIVYLMVVAPVSLMVPALVPATTMLVVVLVSVPGLLFSVSGVLVPVSGVGVPVAWVATSVARVLSPVPQTTITVSEQQQLGFKKYAFY